MRRSRIPGMMQQFLNVVESDVRGRRRAAAAGTGTESESPMSVQDALMEHRIYEDIATYGFADVRGWHVGRWP